MLGLPPLACPEPKRPGLDTLSSRGLDARCSAPRHGRGEAPRRRCALPSSRCPGGGGLPVTLPSRQAPALGSSRAGPGPLFSFIPQLSTLQCSPIVIRTICLVKLRRQWKVSRFPGRCVREAGPGPADGGFPSPVYPLLCPLSHRAAERGGQLLLPFGRTTHGCRARHLCTCLAEVRCPARGEGGAHRPAPGYSSCPGDDLECRAGEGSARRVESPLREWEEQEFLGNLGKGS